MADRFLYLPQIGLCMALVWGTANVAGSRRYRRWLFAAVSALVVAGFMACAWQQTSYWQNSETLWTHTLACTSQNPIAHNGLGTALADRGQVDEAIIHFRKALEIKPDLRGGPLQPGPGLGRPWTCRRGHRPFPEGPGDQARPRGGPRQSRLALASRGQVDEAIAHYRKALEIKPDDVRAHNNLGVALAGRGAVDEAIAHFRKALEIEPDFMQAHINLGDALAGRGRLAEALVHYQKALGLASARNDKAQADVIRARIRLHPSAAPAGHRRDPCLS